MTIQTMKKKVTPLFATQDDLGSVLIHRREQPLMIVRAGMYDTEQPDFVASASALEPTGSYLIAYEGEPLAWRMVEQRRGGVLFALDQAANPRTVALRPGGKITPDIVLGGQLGTVSDHPISDAIYSDLLRMIRRDFVRVQSYFVGPAAHAMWTRGTRLTTNPKGSRDFDLIEES